MYSLLIKAVIAVIAAGVLAYVIRRIIDGVKHKKDTGRVVMDIHLLLGAAIVVLLSLIYSYFDDFQLAGRYIVPALIPVFIWFSQGMESAFKKLSPVVERTVILVIVILFSAANMMSIN